MSIKAYLQYRCAALQELQTHFSRVNPANAENGESRERVGNGGDGAQPDWAGGVAGHSAVRGEHGLAYAWPWGGVGLEAHQALHGVDSGHAVCAACIARERQD